MAVPRNGSRLITVDGTVYRWLVRRKSTFAQELGTPLTFAVEAADSPGQVLSVVTRSARSDNVLLEPFTPVTPRTVERAVRLALAEGWKPDRNGGRFRLALPS